MARLITDGDPIPRHVVAARGQTDFDARLRKPANFRRGPYCSCRRRDHSGRNHRQALMLGIIEKRADQPRLSHWRLFGLGGFEECGAASNCLRSLTRQQGVRSNRLGISTVDSCKRLRRQRIEPGGGFRCRQTEIDRRRWIRRQSNEQCGLAFLKNHFLRQTADALCNAIIEKRYLFGDLELGLGANR